MWCMMISSYYIYMNFKTNMKIDIYMSYIVLYIIMFKTMSGDFYYILDI